MINITELKQKALSQLKNNWGFAIIICLVYTFVSKVLNFNYDWRYGNGVQFYTGLSIILPFLLAPLQLGFSKFILNFIQDRSNACFEDLFYGFTNINLFIKSIVINFIITIGTIIGMALLIVPGIIWLLAFSQTFFILTENPDIRISECLKTSYKFMNGFKYNLFVLNLSFIGWVILSIFTLGIGFLWYVPYYEITLGNFYIQLKEIKKDIEII